MTATPGSVRTFFAVWPPDPVLAELDRALTPLRESAPPTLHWQPLERLHVTLLFLGDCRPGDLRRAQEAGRAAARDAVAAPLRFRGAGRFGAVVWLGVNGPWLTDLQADLRHRLGTPAATDFHPHLSVARSRGVRPDPDVISSLAHVTAAGWLPDSLTLTASTLGPQPRYEIIDRFGW